MIRPRTTPLFTLRWQAHYSVLPHLVMLKTSQRASKAHLIFFLPLFNDVQAPNCSRIRKTFADAVPKSDPLMIGGLPAGCNIPSPVLTCATSWR